MQTLKEIFDDTKGVGTTEVGAVTAIGTVAITIVIVLLVYFNVRNSPILNNTNSTGGAVYNAPTGSAIQTAAQASTLGVVDANVSSGFELFGLVVLVSAAAVILALIAGI